MGKTEPGTRVFALRNADQEAVYSYGTGVYVGDLLPPGVQKECPEADAKQIRGILEDDDSREEPRIFALIDYAVEKGDMTAEDAEVSRKRALEHQARQKERPMEERIQELWEHSSSNPCIELDNGGVVWGMQCWWGPEEAYEKQVAGRQIVLIDPPYMREAAKVEG